MQALQWLIIIMMAMMMMMIMILLSYGLHPLARLIVCFCRTHPLNAGPPVADNNNDDHDNDDNDDNDD